MNYFIDDINYQIKNHPQKFIAFYEEYYNNQVEMVAKSIAENAATAPIVLLSGPSGSGKTTTAMKLEALLDKWGYETHVISLDNYFRELNEEEQKLARDGKLDLEAPDRLDSDYLNMQIRSMLEGISVDIPRYNFTTCKREFSGWTLKRHKDEIIIFEGTHALNPQVITTPDDECARLYVSIRSHFVKGDDAVRSKTIRLARRTLRDVKTRGRDPIDTLEMFELVNIGEDKFIKPFMSRCNYSIDTLIPYEMNVYKTMLCGILPTLPQTEDVKKLTALLEKLEPLDKSFVPDDSLVREFIGESSLNYL